MYEAILYIAIAYTITRHVFINIFQTELFTCEICHGKWEKCELSCDTESEKKSWEVGSIMLGYRITHVTPISGSFRVIGYWFMYQMQD